MCVKSQPLLGRESSGWQSSAFSAAVARRLKDQWYSSAHYADYRVNTGRVGGSSHVKRGRHKAKRSAGSVDGF